MPISYATPALYEHAIGSTAADIAAVASTILQLSTKNINPVNPLGFARKHDEATPPESDVARDLSDGKMQPYTINFRGEQTGDDPDDLFVGLASILNTAAVSGANTYLRSGMYDGTTKQYYRRYGKVLGADVSYIPRSNYSITQLQASFRVLDPALYFDTVRTQAIACSGTSTTQGTVDTGVVRSARLLVKITRTGSGVPTNPQVKNAANQSFTLTGTLAATSDYWLVDMLNKTVIKATSGGTVLTDDIAHFSGQFWGIKNGVDSITVTNGVSASFSVGLTWLERKF